MESGATMEGGEWSTFNGVSVNEEADFMAQLFPNCSFDNELESSSLALSSSCYSGMTGGDSGVFFSNADINSNLYCLSQGSSNYSGNSASVAYPYDESYCLSDAQQYLAANSCSFPVDLLPSVAKNFVQRFPGNAMERNDNLDLEMSCGASFDDRPDFSNEHLQLKREDEMSEMEPATEDRSSNDLLESGRKRSRNSEVRLPLFTVAHMLIMP